MNGYCDDCPDHEACYTGWPCEEVKRVDAMVREEGQWVEAEPLPYMGWKAKLEQVFLMWGMPTFASWMARWDERKLGK